MARNRYPIMRRETKLASGRTLRKAPVHRASADIVPLPLAAQRRASLGSVSAIDIDTAGLRDVSFVVNEVLDGAKVGVFSNLYLEVPWFIGMVFQVFMATLFGRTRIENGKWVRAKLLVTHVDGVAAGFLLLIDTPGDDYDAEIYLCGVAPDYRRRGIATQMIRSEALHMRQGAELAAACLPKAHAMKKLLAKLGFERDRNARSSAPGLRGPEWFRLLKR